jgi:hypothetical protein
MDWIEGGRLIANPPWTDDTETGIYGDPTVASAEKGRRWLAAAVEEKLESVAEIREQLQRREERRRGRHSPASTPTSTPLSGKERGRG